ncbi:MerR family transcriptional regulator [Enterococcus xiangfangensis]|uniref:MerR family transcriptional regulator n=1 Tax=Enterococcus xiangfangensis TaxID=1296537 RepID=A0ABU3FB67_9ENTE|nr:MerR family transcriptional regulator [Enterococcus xiangfangensis]MBM7711015.1 DNA-binding transcriptional MerR regulator [Enterococcus xiangfangensis]MDT2758945.1 MerR family transcriptional regulator [Enterococcus xiangfangensis]
MNYTIKQMAEISGVSPRTLRFYDERSLLKPAFLSEAGYRMYTEKEVDRLQQILLYRSMELPLKTIKELIDRPDEKIQETLLQQRNQLEQKRQELDHLLQVLDNTLRYYKGEIKMTNKEKFEAFKQEKLAENEENYGQEIREKYGEAAVEESNQRWQNMSESDYQKLQETERTLIKKLTQYLESEELPSELAEEIYSLHKSWLQFSWKEYSGEAHKGLSEMYLADERFTHYYDDKSGQGATEALYQIIQYYA